MNSNKEKINHNHDIRKNNSTQLDQTDLVKDITQREKYNEGNHKNIASISTDIEDCDIENIHTGHIGIKVFETHIQTNANNRIHNKEVHPHIIAYPANQDVIDILPYFTQLDENGNKQIMVVMNKSVRPTISARDKLVPHAFGEEGLQSGMVYECLGINISAEQGDISISTAATRALQSKTGLKKKQGSNTLVQTPYYSAVGSLSEACIPQVIEIDTPQKIETYTKYGTGFDGQRNVTFMSLQEVVDGYFNGSIQGLRLLHLALELARVKNISLHIPKIFSETKKMTSYPSISDKIVTHATLQEVINNTIQSNNGINKIQLIENNALYNNKQSFQYKKIVNAKNIRNDGTQDNYQAEMVVRDTVDTIEIVPHFRHDNKLMVPIRAVLRPSIQTRNHELHPIHIESKVRNIEGVSGRAIGNEFSKDQVIKNAEKTLLEKTGLSPLGTMEYIGSSFPSIGVTPEKKHTVYSIIDPTNINKGATVPELDHFDPINFFIDVDELIRSWEQGLIQDPSLVMHANILKQLYGYTNSIDLPPRFGNKEEYNELQSIMEGPLQTDEFMKKVAKNLNKPEIYQSHIGLMKKSAHYRKQVCFNEQEQGATLFTEDMGNSPIDNQYFDPAIPNFRVPPKEVAEKYAAYSGHDGTHYVYGGPAAWDIETGTFISKELFVKINTRYESRAVCISDYLLPIDMGLDEFEEIIGGHKCLGRSLQELGINDYKEAHKIVTSIERDGIIPDTILLHPHYEQNRGNIVGRVLGFKPNDTYQSEAEYDYYVSNPEVAKVKAKFTYTVSSIKEAQERINSFEQVLQEYPEGVNKFKAKIASIQTTHIVNPAMRAGVFLQHLIDNKIPGFKNIEQQVHSLLDQLYYRKEYNTDSRNMVKSMLLNDQNIVALRRMKLCLSETNEIIKTLTKLIKNTNCITEQQRDSLLNNYRPYFQGFVKMDPETNKKMINELEQKNLRRVGKILEPYYTI